ncbi:hypothetical protein M3Y97_01168900 [Aphelenchoides bicaudatus]|nr:hypothetical protein M3Y97_01168900 [Aphelenchoides bicaudatus]
MRAGSSYSGKLLGAASVVVEYIGTAGKGIEYSVQKIKQVAHVIKEFSAFMGSSNTYLVSKVQKISLRVENNNFWHSLDSFVVDFGKSVNDVAQIQANFNSTATGFVVVANVIKKANGVVGDIKSIRQKIIDAKNQFNKIHEDVKSAGQSFKQIASDFKSVVETVSKGNGNLPIDRKPLTPAPKKPDPPKQTPKKPEPTTTKKPADASKVISIRCNTNKFVWSDAADGNAMKCFKDTPGHFKMTPTNGKVSLQSGNTNKYCSSEDSKEAMHCNRDVVQEWELFEKVDNSDGTVSFKCSNNKYMSSQNGLKPMDCTGDKIAEWEKFRIE